MPRLATPADHSLGTALIVGSAGDFFERNVLFDGSTKAMVYRAGDWMWLVRREAGRMVFDGGRELVALENYALSASNKGAPEWQSPFVLLLGSAKV
jgi:hypothetical protein